MNMMVVHNQMYSAMLVASVYLVVMVHSLDSDRGPMQPSHMIEPVLDRPQAPPPPQPCCALPMTGDRWECIVWYCHDVPPPLNYQSKISNVDCGHFNLEFYQLSQSECCVIQLKNPIRPDPSLREITNPQCVCLCESAMNSLPVSPQIDTMRKSEFSNFTQMTQKPLLAITETIQRPLSSNAVTAKNPLTASTEVSQSTLSTIKDPTKKNPEASSAQAAQDDVWSSAQDTAQSRELSTSYSVDMMESRTEAIDLDKREKSAGYTAAITNGVLIGGFCVIFGVALFVFMRRRKRKKLKGKPDAKRPITNHPMVRTVCGNAESSLSVSISEKKTIKLEEISRKNIRLLNIIGKGTFGTVVKAEVYRLNMKWTAKTDDWITVAVKMTSVSDTQNEETKTDFLAEVYLMKSIPPHRNVISIYGSCTGQDPFLMLLEFSVNGDLKKYLVQLRENKEMSKTTYSAYDNIAFQQGNSRIITAGNNEMLSLKTMLSFALQICRGLDHLAINKIVHRDVAARNILLFEHNIVKISDFGLARRVGQSDIYERTRKGLLPIRWMSPETVMFNQFSEKSDVWSFGILLWEMITLCLIPYSELDVDQVVEKIKGGELLLCPMNSPGEIQTIMFSCWRSSPTCRPTFSELCKQLEKTLEEHSDYIDLDVTDDHEYSTIT